MPWVPELFSAPALARLEDRLRREELDTVPYFAGFLTGETDALIQSFAGEPEIHYPVRGRVKGERAFAVAKGPEVAARLAADHAYIEALRRGEEPVDARLEQDWVFGIHQSNLEQARGR